MYSLNGKKYTLIYCLALADHKVTENGTIKQEEKSLNLSVEKNAGSVFPRRPLPKPPTDLWAATSLVLHFSKQPLGPKYCLNVHQLLETTADLRL